MSYRNRPLPPATEQELLHRCAGIAGRSIGELAEQYRTAVPANLKQARGYIGRLLERVLGTDGGARPAPDFSTLNIELKSIPIDSRGRPRQATRVCAVQSDTSSSWESSLLRRKLARVLWVPYCGNKQLPVAAHRIGNPILRDLTAEDELVLRADWEEFMACIGTGRIEQIAAGMGLYLQVRVSSSTARKRLLPRNFYLKPCYTHRILQTP